jgi:hypothetical protein
LKDALLEEDSFLADGEEGGEVFTGFGKLALGIGTGVAEGIEGGSDLGVGRVGVAKEETEIHARVVDVGAAEVAVDELLEGLDFGEGGDDGEAIFIGEAEELFEFGGSGAVVAVAVGDVDRDGGVGVDVDGDFVADFHNVEEGAGVSAKNILSFIVQVDVDGIASAISEGKATMIRGDVTDDAAKAGKLELLGRDLGIGGDGKDHREEEGKDWADAGHGTSHVIE